jgi:hypothetical protein
LKHRHDTPKKKNPFFRIPSVWLKKRIHMSSRSDNMCNKNTIRITGPSLPVSVPRKA